MGFFGDEGFGMNTWLPAYGRDYKSAKAVLEDIKANKTFETASGRLIDMNSYIKVFGPGNISVRYKKNRSQVYVYISENTVEKK